MCYGRPQRRRLIRMLIRIRKDRRLRQPWAALAPSFDPAFTNESCSSIAIVADVTSKLRHGWSGSCLIQTRHLRVALDLQKFANVEDLPHCHADKNHCLYDRPPKHLSAWLCLCSCSGECLCLSVRGFYKAGCRKPDYANRITRPYTPRTLRMRPRLCVVVYDKL